MQPIIDHFDPKDASFATAAIIDGNVPYIQVGDTGFALVGVPDLGNLIGGLGWLAELRQLSHAYLVNNGEQTNNFFDKLDEVGGEATLAVHGSRETDPTRICLDPQGLRPGGPQAQWGAGIYMTTEPGYAL